MKSLPELDSIAGKKLTIQQKQYLNGFFAGLAAKGVTFGDLTKDVAAAEPGEPAEPLILEERIKRDEHPLDSYYRIVENAAGDEAPEKEEIFRFKWNGLFYLTPVKEAFMARLRIPGGQLRSFQVREIAAISRELTTGYIQITTRANFQLRLIRPTHAPAVLRRIQSVGLHTRGAGADNVRNLTTNATAGIDPVEVIDCTPFVQELAHFILAQREFYDLPRKFNVAFDGGGIIGCVEDTNDIGAKAVRLGEKIGFRLAVGGATGHKAFARDLGVVVPPESLVQVMIAMLRVYIANGNRSDRKKARLKHLLDNWTLDRFVVETEARLGKKLERVALDSKTLAYPSQEIRHSHIGVYQQKQPSLYYIGVALPVGQVTPHQLNLLADLAEKYGSGEIRLTVWQNLILPGIRERELENVKRALRRAGLGYAQSNLASGVIACTGNRFCKYSSTDTKGHALALIKYLEPRIKLDVPVNIHFTGCPHSCAQHYMGDIGLLGVKSTSGLESYHLCLGGGFGNNRAIGRQVFSTMPFEEVKPTIERILRIYLERRQPGESFQAFTTRHDLNALQTMFSE
jgi:ferredoxin-nitrite reductase